MSNKQEVVLHAISFPIASCLAVIEVYETEGTGKNRTQRIMIYYRFVGYIEISSGDRKRNHTAETRKGVAVQYLTTKNEQSA